MERSWAAQRGDNHIHRARVLEVRIQYPPARSLRTIGSEAAKPPLLFSKPLEPIYESYWAFYRFDFVILLSSARIGIFSRSSALRRVQSIPVGVAPGRLMRIAWVGVAITLSG